MRWNAPAAAAAGLALRLAWIWRFPAIGAGDSRFYEELARNWSRYHVYGLWISGRLQPVDMRVPGYPAFLNIIAALAGRSHWPAPVLIAQSVLDLLGCFLIAAVAAEFAPPDCRQRVRIAALWLAVLCPFIADYSAAVLTEVLACFLTSLMLWILLRPGGLTQLPGSGIPAKISRTALPLGFVAGCGALVRPETPLLLASTGLVLAYRCRHPQDWRVLIRTGILMAIGLVIPLAPWAARNWITLHEVQFLNPRYSELPGEFVARGMNSWTGTWLWRFRDVYLVSWKVDDQPILLSDLPRNAFDSPQERKQVARLLNEYNAVTTMNPEIDAGFAELARERTARHPLRTFVEIPALRAAAMWFTPRVEYLPYSGKLWPPRTAWRNDPADFSVTLGLALINVIFLSLAAVGAWKARRHPATAFLIAFILLRTAFFTQTDTPEPRYMLECYPAILALGAQAWRRSADATPREPLAQDSPSGSG